jgi:hypothetical protein
MHQSGAHCLVVPLKRSNVRGERGRATRVGAVPINRYREEPAGFDGRQSPSTGGTSHVSREAYARFREGLAVRPPLGLLDPEDVLEDRAFVLGFQPVPTTAFRFSRLGQPHERAEPGLDGLRSQTPGASLSAIHCRARISSAAAP